MGYTGKNIDLSKYDKYGKNVELSKVEVELSSIKEIDNFIKILKNNIQESEKEGVRYSQAEAEVVRAWLRLNDFTNSIKMNAGSSARKVIEDFKAKAKELGINTDNFPQVKELDKLISNVFEYVKYFEKVQRPKEQI